MNKKRKEKIGVFGGTFDPVHLGHLIIAEDLRGFFELSRVIFMPALAPPHKAGKAITSGRHRLAMLKLAVEGRAGLEVSDMELKRGGKSYTIDTIRALKKQKAAEYFFFAGSDSVKFLPRWKEVDALVRECTFVLMIRPGFMLDEMSIVAKKMKRETMLRLGQNVMVVRQIDISSTEIRKRAQNGQPISHLTPLPVAQYIKKHKLY
jgi:nicotinate-nucleotide adenylyltransferase